MKRLACSIFGVWMTAAAGNIPAQTYTNLISFSGTDGSYPIAQLTQATDGKLYGTATSGGAYTDGTIFAVSPVGSLSLVYSFCPSCPTSSFNPYAAGIVQATNGGFYGMTSQGGTANEGTVYRVGTNGILTTIYSFCAQSGCQDGSSPYGGLVQASNGDFYGTTSTGGTNGHGTVFRITTAGTLTTLYSFCVQPNCTDGAAPEAALIQATNGDLYGTTARGGVNNTGTVFRITPAGALTRVQSFTACAGDVCAGAANPAYESLVQGTNGNFYGTTRGGGAHSSGTVFRITPAGVLTTLYSFCALSGCVDGYEPEGGLTLATDGNFYGTTYFGGTNYDGTIFQITPGGTLTTLHSFTGPAFDPIAAPLQDTNGVLYGTTNLGGNSGNGTVYSLSLGLSPFVKTQTVSGEVGTTVKILGTDLTGATSVTFNGVSSAFKISPSGTYISATVPAGATTGTVQVVTPLATLDSNVSFRIP